MLGILRVNNKEVTPLKPLTKEDIEKLLSSGIVTSGRMGGKEMATQVLGEMYLYKCIEEKFKIDITTLFKALTVGYWHKRKDGELCFHSVEACKGKHPLYYCISGENGEWGFCIHCEGGLTDGFYRDEIGLQDYGVTWALTKEELENQGEKDER